MNVWVDRRWAEAGSFDPRSDIVSDFPSSGSFQEETVENQEARERGQGAAHDSPRCLTVPPSRQNLLGTKDQKRLIVNIFQNLLCFHFLHVGWMENKASEESLGHRTFTFPQVVCENLHEHQKIWMLWYKGELTTVLPSTWRRETHS